MTENTTIMSFFEEKNPEMDRYLEDHASEEPEILKKLRRETYQKTTQPHMISGYQQGRLLTIISKILQPKKISNHFFFEQNLLISYFQK